MIKATLPILKKPTYSEDIFAEYLIRQAEMIRDKASDKELVALYNEYEFGITLTEDGHQRHACIRKPHCTAKGTKETTESPSKDMFEFNPENMPKGGVWVFWPGNDTLVACGNLTNKLIFMQAKAHGYHLDMYAARAWWKKKVGL